MSDKPRKPIEWKITDHGWEYPEYFMGHSPYPKFTYSATGVGETSSDALDDALEQLAKGNFDFTDVLSCPTATEIRTENYNAHDTCEHGSMDDCPIRWYVSVDLLV